MSSRRSGGAAWKVCIGAGVLALQGIGAVPAHAQSAAAAAAEGAPSEAARRQALSPFRMILQNADAPRRAPVAPVPGTAAKRAPAAPAATQDTPAATASAAPSAAATQQAAPAPAPQVDQVTAVQPSAAAAKAPAPPPEPDPIELIPIKQEAPVLTAALRREQLQGKVTVAFAVKPDGTTSDVHVVSTSDRRLNSASVNAVSAWRFKPIAQPQPVEVELVFGDR